jgi:hypothetical protein
VLGLFLRAGCAGAAWVYGGSLGSCVGAGGRCLLVGSRRNTLLYGDSNEHEMIEGRPVYESTKVSEALADASGGSGTEGGDSGEWLHFKLGEVVADDMQSKPSSGFRASRRRFRAVQARFPMLSKMMHLTQLSPGSQPGSSQRSVRTWRSNDLRRAKFLRQSLRRCQSLRAPGYP